MRGRAAAVLVALAVGCGPAPAPAPVANRGATTPPPVAVVAVLSMTGELGTFGQSIERGARLAAQQLAVDVDSGRRPGPAIELTTVDDGGRPADAAAALAAALAGHPAVAVIGSTTSAVSLALAEAAAARGLPMIAPIATSAAVPAVGERVFAIALGDTAQGRAAAAFAHDVLRAQRQVVVVDEQSSYSLALARGFAERADLVSSLAALVPLSGGAAPAVNAVAAARADVVFAPTYYADAPALVAGLRAAGVTAPVVGGDGWDSDQLVADGGAALDGCYHLGHFALDDPAPAVRAFVADYQRAHGVPPDALAALGFDAVGVLHDALARAPGATGAELAAALAATRGFPGVAGDLGFDADRQARKSAVVMAITGGQRRFARRIAAQ